MHPEHKLAFVASESEMAQGALRALRQRYNEVPVAQASCIVALGGDGFLIESLHKFLPHHLPFFGMNCGTVGFLMNNFGLDALPQRLATARTVPMHPLRMTAYDSNGKAHSGLALNEVSLLRQTRQAAKIKIIVDNIVRLEELVCDGVLLATPAGSTAYNFSAHGPILPLNTKLLALTPISAFRPRRWRGAILPNNVQVRLEVLESDKRPVSAVADVSEVRDVQAVEIVEDTSVTLRLLFDADHSLEDRVIKEQFTV